MHFLNTYKTNLKLFCISIIMYVQHNKIHVGTCQQVRTKINLIDKMKLITQFIADFKI